MTNLKNIQWYVNPNKIVTIKYTHCNGDSFNDFDFVEVKTDQQ